jgi:small-conductance mechanosensitive channel
VNSVLAIGGVGGLAVGLAGREILENLFTGLIILSSRPFDIGDEVQFTPPSGQVCVPPRPLPRAPTCACVSGCSQ